MALRKITSLFGIIAFAAMMIFVLAGCEDPKSPPLKVIDIASIQGVTVPVTGATPITTITENAQYRGTVTWSYNPVAFVANVQYTATINLTPKSGYTLKGVEANFFTVAGATSVSNDANSGIITAVFPSGCSITIDMYDSDGNGWDRAALKIEVNGTVLSTNATIISGDFNSYVFNVTNGDSVNIYWISGDYDSECSFIMYYTDKPPIPEFTASNNSSWSGVNALIYKSFNTLNSISSGALISSFTVEGRTIIDIAAIKGVTIPAIGGIPVTTITENAQYIGTVTWNGNPSVFIASTAYMATITLTPKAGYTLHGVAANFFTVTGAASVSNAANSGIVTAVFPVTAKINLSISITAPVKGATPTATANSNTESGGNFTIGQVSWSPSHNPFLGGTVYTASVTLTANGGYTFTGLNSATVNGQNAAVSNNTGSAVTLSYTFPETNTKTVTDISIKTQPTKLTYTHGDPLDLTGLVITLTHDDTTTEDVSAADFTAKNVTVIPAQGNNLVHSMHNGQPVKISYGSLMCKTSNLTIIRNPTAADFNIRGIGTFTYDGNPKTITITPNEGKSGGTITVKYNDSTTAPSATGTYIITFDVTAAIGFNAASGLSAGTVMIEKATPVAADFNISGIGTFEWDGSPKTVIITPKEGKSNGNITIEYNGNITAPSNVGTYNVTFNIAETTNYSAVSGLSAGNMTITTEVVFNSVTANGSALQSSTLLTLTFSQEITGLSASDITLSGVSGVTKGYLNSSGATYYLPIYGLKTGGTLTVTIAKSGYTIRSTPKTVTIYYYYYSGVSPGTIEMASIPAGTFIMGSPTTESSRQSDEGPQHSVTLSSFKMSKYQVTQAQYRAVMGTGEDRTITDCGKGDNYPIYYVSWYDAIVFCNKLSLLQGLDPVYSIDGSTNPADWGTIPTTYYATWNAAVMDKSKNGYRLPTEAEWEYACRAGTTTAYNTGDTISDNTGWYYGDSGYSRTHEVGLKPANAWGLYDMHGNVLEWCWDWYGSYSTDSQTDPLGADSGSYRVIRGGFWLSYGQNLRSACRDGYNPSDRLYSFGFRLVCP